MKKHGKVSYWTKCHAKWGGRLAISLSSVWRLEGIDWSFLSALITPAWGVRVALSFWWMHFRYLRGWRRVMMDGNGDKSNGVSARLLWEAYSFWRCFWGEIGDDEGRSFAGHFWEDRLRGWGEESSGQRREMFFW